MDEAARTALGPGVTGLLNPVPAQRARLLLAQGDVAAAAAWTSGRGLGPDDEPRYPREREYLVLARVLLAQDRPVQALKLLEGMLTAAAVQSRTGSVIEIGSLRALALAARGDQDAAADALTRALALGCPQGYVRMFADEGAPMRALLARLVAAQLGQRTSGRDITPATARLLRACDAAGDAAPRGRAAASPGLIEPLTERELEVLRLLAAGRSNQRIAHELVVALDTVKKHVTHILGKLGAANRTEAAVRARQVGLIPSETWASRE